MAKKKILLLSDDLRMSSGVGTMSREFVLGFTNSGIPTAAIIMSAPRHSDFKFIVLEWVIVTVQFSLRSNCAIGFPFKLDLPIITTFLPLRFGSTPFNKK